MSLKKKQAYILFVENNVEIKEVARIVGVSERTIWRWNKEENWREMKNVRIHAPAKMASLYYLQSEALMQKAHNEKRVLTDKEAKTMASMAATIDKLSKYDKIGFHIRAMDNFMGFLSKKDLKLAQAIADYSLQFLKRLQRGPSHY